LRELGVICGNAIAEQSVRLSGEADDPTALGCTMDAVCDAALASAVCTYYEERMLRSVASGDLQPAGAQGRGNPLKNFESVISSHPNENGEHRFEASSQKADRQPAS